MPAGIFTNAPAAARCCGQSREIAAYSAPTAPSSARRGKRDAASHYRQQAMGFQQRGVALIAATSSIDRSILLIPEEIVTGLLSPLSAACAASRSASCPDCKRL